MFYIYIYIYIYILSIFWLVRTTKAILFWLYLWQLKEYHIGRFLDHFRTEKGERILFNKLLILKIILLFSLLSSFLVGYALIWRSPNYQVFIYSLIILYSLETAKAFFDFLQKKLIKPVFTKKIFFLFFANLALLIFYLLSFFQKETSFLFWLLIFDVFTPIIVSGTVFLFQPLAILGKNQIIKKAKEKRAQLKNLLVIAITGSYGKTSTKEFLATILAEKFNPVKSAKGGVEQFNRVKVLKTKENQNNEIGVSRCVLEELEKDHQIFVVEMGAYKKGEIKLLCDIVRPKIGIVTGINEQHLALFGSMENLLSAEGGEELIDSLPPDGLVIFNGNNKYCQQIYEKIKTKKKITYPIFSTIVENVVSGNFWAKDIKVEKEFVSFKVFSRDGDSADFRVNLLGAQNVENILLAACCAKELGMNLKEISKACEKIKPEQGGMKLLKGINGLNILDATYSANPDSVISHLEYLKIWEGKKAIVMPCLIELGKATVDVHKRIGKKIGEICDLAIIITKERFEDLKTGALEARMEENKIVFSENPKIIFQKVKEFNEEDDIVLLEGRLPSELKKVFLIKE